MISGVNSACNAPDQHHQFQCPSGHSIFRVSGHYDHHTRDRVYCYNCRSNSRSAAQCLTIGYVNLYDSPVVFGCNPDWYLAGVKSQHDNTREDRRFQYTCCRNDNQCTRNCHIRGPVNDFNGPMHYELEPNQVIVSTFSWHRNDKE